jgi:hypothetical protein
MDGAMPGVPRLAFGVVDVRDVADLHLRAMADPAAKGERFLAVSGDFLSIREMALILKARLGRAARRVPTRQLPDVLVRLAGLFDPAVRQIVPELGRMKNATSAKARRLLAARGGAGRDRRKPAQARPAEGKRKGRLGQGQKRPPALPERLVRCIYPHAARIAAAATKLPVRPWTRRPTDAAPISPPARSAARFSCFRCPCSARTCCNP